MTQYLLKIWKNSRHGLLDATHFALVIADRECKHDEQALIIETFNDWDLLTPVWFQLVDAVENLKRLAQTKNFPAANAAWLLASKILYFSRSNDAAMRFALAAGDAFSIHPLKDNVQDGMYKQKMVEQAIDHYKELRGRKAGQNIAKQDQFAVQLEHLVGQIFERTVAAKDYRLVIGLALESNRPDIIKTVIASERTDGSQMRTELLLTTLEFIGTIVRDERKQSFYELVIELFGGLIFFMDFNGQYALLECLTTLGRSDDIVKFFGALAKLEASLLKAYQLAFELKEFASHQFLDKICLGLAAITGGEAEKKTLSTIQSILKGRESARFYHHFLVLRNQADVSVITRIRDSVRNACTLNAALIANGLMHMGTTSDVFLKDNLKWISTATNWNKFNAVASLGLIHKGNEANAKKILEPYLPKESEQQQQIFKFKEGGALYAYGLIHANCVGDGTAINFLTKQIDMSPAPAFRHGAALGLGLAACGTQDLNVYAKLRETLHLDEAVTGEAAGLAMGMVMAASMDQKAFQEMRKFMQESQHNKIQRGLQIGCAMLAFGHDEAAEKWIASLLAAKSNSVLRQAGVWMTAMAYVGVGRPAVVERLLDLIAVDPNQDVKRFAAIALGFVLCNDSQQCLEYTGMLVDHFNGHVRYGAAIAIGISCTGSGHKEAIAQLEPLLYAKENYVRQGAFIALAMVMIQKTKVSCTTFRNTINTLVATKGEDSIVKFGAIVAQGILDAGGRNVTLSLHKRYDQVDMPSVLGMLVFLQHWYWHSMVHFISLAFRPTCVIALNKDLRMPKMQFHCNAKSLSVGSKHVAKRSMKSSFSTKRSIRATSSKKSTRSSSSTGTTSTLSSRSSTSSTTTSSSSTGSGTITAKSPASSGTKAPKSPAGSGTVTAKSSTSSGSGTKTSKSSRSTSSGTTTASSSTSSTSSTSSSCTSRSSSSGVSSTKTATSSSCSVLANRKILKLSPLASAESSEQESSEFQFCIIENPARVTLAQMASVEIANRKRFLTIRPTVHPGGIVMVSDTSSGARDAEFIEFPSDKTVTALVNSKEAPKPSPFQFDLANY